MSTFGSGYEVGGKKYLLFSYFARIKGSHMFRESELIRKAKDINIGKNMRDAFQKECYCKRNEGNRRAETQFEVARRENLATTYFGTPRDKDLCLMMHTKPLEQARFLKTCNTVSGNLNKLKELGDRNWNSYDYREDKHVSGLMVTKMTTPSVASLKHGTGLKLPRCGSLQQCQMASLQGKSLREGTKILPGLASCQASNTVRVFSPQQSCYVDQPAKYENESQKLAYNTMRSSNNLHSIQICGTAGLSNGRPFEKAVTRIQTNKPYTVSAETFNSSWVDCTRAQTTMNYESSKFNIINHGFGNSSSITNLIKDNPKACYKVKSIAEYSDLTRVTAPKQNKDYQDALKKAPACFTKSTALCSKQIDYGKTYGPFFSLFK